jgi:insertion element IS1 protein InsB
MDTHGAPLAAVHTALLHRLPPRDMDRMSRRVDEAAGDALWSLVGTKQDQRWLWHAIEHRTGAVLASVVGRRPDEVFRRLKALLEPVRITRVQTDEWGAYGRPLDPAASHPGKHTTQTSARKPLT